MNQADVGRTKRGQVSQELLAQYKSISNIELVGMLADKNTQTRTAAATLLGERTYEPSIEKLCAALRIEKELYPRLAICEALACMGEPAVDPLIELLGKIGSNQHRALPDKGFYKRSYPLPRDIAARTLIRMGLPVLEKIDPMLRSAERFQLLEAVDVVGHISNQYATSQCLLSLLGLYDISSNDALMQWKIVRAFQAFPDQQVTEILLGVINHSPIAPLRREALRSLGLQDREYDRKILQVLQYDGDKEIRLLIELFF